MPAYDVAIIGGGMAGSAAAISAAKLGARTLLIESFGFLGGWATAGLVNPFMTHRTAHGPVLVAGVFADIQNRLDTYHARLENSFDSEYLRFVLQEMVLEAGADLRLHTTFESAQYLDDGGIRLRTFSKTGHEDFDCLRLIDSSGDGDAAVSLGAHYEMGDENGVCQATTLMFDAGGVDLERALEYVRDNPDQMRFPKLTAEADIEQLASGVIGVAGYYAAVSEARSRGEYDAPGDLLFYINRPRRGEVVFNTTHVGDVDGTNAADLTRAEIEGRRQMMSVLAFTRKYIPGFENVYLLRSAAHIGVRETRRIMGDYVFSEYDVIEARKFDDAICRLAYPVDVHSGKGEGYTRKEERGTPQAPPPGDWYEIPYRCLLPSGLENVLVAGRCVSSTHAGHGAIRIMPCCSAQGQAAGTAAALSLRHSRTPRELDSSLLITELREQGALV